MNMKKGVPLSVLGIVLAAGMSLLADAQNPASNSAANVPVLVELFTSEGCSSCPPADAFLQKLDLQPFAGAQIIVLSEHVDYWNHDGWTDPYSSHAFSQRQDAYSNRFQLKSVYTPQMIVDGDHEFVGNSSGEAQQVIEKAVRAHTLSVRVSGVTLEGDRLRAHVDADALPARSGHADIVFVVALDHAESQVAKGENAGRRLTHVAVVRSLATVGRLESGKDFSKDVSVKVADHSDPANLRLIAFIQEPGPGRVLGATMARVRN